MTKLNPKKMKVAELKAELESRNIEVAKGLKKADLIVMLSSALESESGDGNGSVMFSEDDNDVSGMNQSEVGITEEDSLLLTEDEPASEGASQEAEETAIEESTENKEEICEQEEPAALVDEEEKMEAEDTIAEPTVEEPATEKEVPVVEPPTQAPLEEPTETSVEEPQAETPTEEVQEVREDGEKPQEQSDETPDEGFGSAPAATDSAPDSQESTSGEVHSEEKAKEEKSQDEVKTEKHRSHSDRKERSSEGGRSESDHSSRKRRHDDHDRRDRHRRYEDRYDRYAPPPEEPEEEFDDTLVVLDKYNSDLNMKLHRDRLTGLPLTLEGFAYLWAGARATYGVKAGKMCYECKLTEEHSVRHVSSSEPNRHLVRVGWSPNSGSRLLGEEELSFAYCGTAKKVTNAKVEDYGETFKQGDVIGAYIDLTDEENATITYTKNGTSLGVAFTIEKEKLSDVAMFPHVLCKNTTVEMNFGQKEAPFFPHPEGLEDYVFIASVPLEERVRGTVGPTARKDCEVLMLCGLPGAGKTYYANNYVKEHPEKNYSILGTNALMRYMKVSGLETKGSRDALMQHATNCLNRLSQVACRKKRNFILDQTNVYSSAQRRRMRTYEGYRRKAIVIVPSDEEFKSRVEKRTKDEGKDIPDIAVYEMKANFTFPEVGDLFDEVTFAELDKDEATKVIESYREEARKKGPPPEKRLRGNYDMNRSGPGGRGGWGGFDNRMMGSRPPYRGGGMGGGGGGYNRFGGGQRGSYRDAGRGDNRRGGGGSSGGGGWNKGGGNWQQNRSFGGGRGGGGGSSNFQSNNRGGYGGNRSGSGPGNRNNSRPNQNRNQQQNNRSNFQNRNPRGGGQRGGGPQSNFNYHQAYQQQAAQFSTHNQPHQAAPAYQQQGYAQQAPQPDYSQQWAQYYQQQAAAQQQQAAAAAAAAQYQNYYAHYQNYGNQAIPKPPQ